MFGMSSEEFWEQDPKLYWAFRTFYLKQKEIEYKEKNDEIKYTSWLRGNMEYIAHSVALNNAFSKKKQEFPSFDKVFVSDTKEQKKKTKNEINKKVQEEFNSWARF